MKINLTGKRRSQFHLVTVGEDSFDLEVTAPSLADQLLDSELAATSRDGNWLRHRLESTVTGWHRINDENEQAILFTWEAFVALCDQCPEVLSQAVRLAHLAYAGLTEDRKKN